MRFIAGICGLINDGDAGSTEGAVEVLGEANIGWITRPFKLRGLRGEGEVIGRESDFSSDEIAIGIGGASKVCAGDRAVPKVVEG